VPHLRGLAMCVSSCRLPAIAVRMS
jgi:hypothetical protein